MAGGKQDWGFWTFWLTVAAALIAAGGVLPSQSEYPGVSKTLISVVSRALIIAGIGVLAVSMLSLALSPLKGLLAVLPAATSRMLKRISSALVKIYARVGAFLLKPILTYASREAQSRAPAPAAVPAGPVSSWTARDKWGPQKSDLLSFSKDGHLLSSVHFTVRPDYTFRNWYAGFRLTTAADDVRKTELDATVWFYLVDSDRQPTCHLYVERRAQGPFGLRNFGQPHPSFEFDIALYPAGAGELCAAISVDKEWVHAVTFPRRYAEQLVLLAFADGRDFRIHFEEVSVNWSE
jgi:hypothetical protein